MYRRAFARYRTGAALLLGLSLRAPSASAELAEPDETRVGTVEGEAAEELPSAAETPPIPAAPIVAPRLTRDEGRRRSRAGARRALLRACRGPLDPEARRERARPELERRDATVRVEFSRHRAEQTNVQLVPGDEAGVSFALSPCVELAGVAEAALEVTVRSQHSALGVSSYTREEVPRNPAAFGDPSRAFEALPGVIPVDSWPSYFYVRGAPPGNVGYFLDRVRVPYLYHIGFGPSVLHPGLIGRVDLYPGGYPAHLGRLASGVVSAQTRGTDPALSREANLRLFDVGGPIETLFAHGGGSLLPALLSLLSPEVKLDYRDYQTRATYEPSGRDRFSAFGFGPYDLLGEKRNGILSRLGDSCRPRITFTW